MGDRANKKPPPKQGPWIVLPGDGSQQPRALLFHSLVLYGFQPRGLQAPRLDWLSETPFCTGYEALSPCRCGLRALSWYGLPEFEREHVGETAELPDARPASSFGYSTEVGDEQLDEFVAERWFEH